MSEEEIYTIIFWVKASASNRAYRKMLEATKDLGDDIKMTAVAPRLCTLNGDQLQSLPTTVKTEVN